MNDEIKIELETQEQLLRKWLDNYVSATRVASLVQRAYEQKSWQVKTMSAMPEAASEIPHEHLSTMLAEERAFWNSALPPMPSYDVFELTTGSALSASAGSNIYSFVSRAGYLDDAQTQRWSNASRRQYEQLQAKQQRVDETHSFLGQLNQSLAMEFVEGETAYRLWCATSGSERTGVAIALRNVLEHFKGRLLDLAIQRPAEQKIKWKDMALRLARKGGEKGLQDAEWEWNSLHKRLTLLAKNDSSGSATDLGMLFTEWVDHIYTVLLFIDPKHYS